MYKQMSHKAPNPEMHALALTDDDALYEGMRRVFDHSRWELHRAGSLEEVSRLLEDKELASRLAVALSGSKVCDGCWRDLIARLQKGGSTASVVVVDRQASDELWRDVLGGGGFEVLSFPPDPHELFRVVTQAWRRWRSRKETLTHSA